ncbi:low choriolytic enzyme-like [Tubulanus polymorphus]|uniref:low choriolytic enzyme-like n=1 Tax=Tubulanus polymorphus TaxID=672921 RepID=UPI003DA214A7
MDFFCILVPILVVIFAEHTLATKLGKAEENARKFPEYRSGQYQGDIDLSQMIDWRNGIRRKSMLWPNGKVTYEFSDDYPVASRDIIRKAIKELVSKVNADGHDGCVEFVEKKSNEGDDYVFIEDKPTCMSPVGMLGGKQKVLLGSFYCLEQMATVQHEMLHTLGFWHEQARTDRNKYVKINFENVAKGQVHNFDMETENMDLLNTPYNYHSILHYDEYAFSTSADQTIVALEPGVELGSRTLEGLDVERVRILYECGPTSRKSVDCEDLRPDCDYFFDKGYCVTRVGQMRLFCAKMCRFCG